MADPASNGYVCCYCRIGIVRARPAVCPYCQADLSLRVDGKADLHGVQREAAKHGIVVTVNLPEVN